MSLQQNNGVTAATQDVLKQEFGNENNVVKAMM
jgi:hypothetical protein